MHRFFEAKTDEELAAAMTEVQQMEVLDVLSGWGRFDDWQRLELPIEIEHAQVPGSSIRSVPIVPSSMWPEELGVDGRPRVSRIVSAMLRLGYRHAEACHVGVSDAGLLKRALDRYIAAIHGRHVASFQPCEWPGPEIYEDDTQPPRAISCRWDGEEVLVELSDARWLRLGESVSDAQPPTDDWCFLEALERSLLQNRDGIHLLMEVLDYPVVDAPSQDRRWLWAMDKHGSGAIFDTKDGLVAAAPPRIPEDPQYVLERDGTITRVPTEEELESIEDEAEYDAALTTREDQLDAIFERVGGPAALSVVVFEGKQARIVALHQGLLTDGSMIGFPYDAAAERELTWRAGSVVR